MKKLGIFLLIFSMFLTMAMTKPSKKEYVTWVMEQNHTLGKNSLSIGTTDTIKTLIVENMTKEKNFLFFATYRTHVEDIDAEVVGIFGEFLFFSLAKNIGIFILYLCFIGVGTVLLLRRVLKDKAPFYSC